MMKWTILDKVEVKDENCIIDTTGKFFYENKKSEKL